MPAARLAKLTRPRTEGLLQRERLFALLDEACKRPVIWIAGPPGAGKTSVASTYLEARKVFFHCAVLNDIDVAEGRDDALSDGVIPTRNVGDNWNREPSGREQEWDGVVGLDVREHECRALALHALAESVGHVAQRSEVPGLHPPLEPVPAWKPPPAR